MSIGPTISLMIGLLSGKGLDTIKAIAHGLSKLSEQGKIKISDLNVIDLLVDMFRESIRHAIPEFIALLSHSELNVCEAGADALVKLSEQGTTSSFLT